MSYEEIYLEAEEKIEKAVEHFAEELRKVRTGRANPSLVDGLRVACYGTETPMKQLAQITAADAQMLLIRPFDPGSIGAVEKAILAANLGLTPSNDGKVVRVAVPPLSEERRKQYVAGLQAQGEKAKVAIRNIRRDAMKALADEKKAGEIPEDDAKRGEEEIHAMVKKHEAVVDERLKKKSEELMTV